MYKKNKKKIIACVRWFKDRKTTFKSFEKSDKNIKKNYFSHIKISKEKMFFPKL